MGRAKILSGGADGLYRIEIDAGFTRVASRIAQRDQQIAFKDAEIVSVTAKRDEAQMRLDAATLAANDAIDAYAAALRNPESTADQREAARQLVVQTTTTAQRISAEVSEYNVRLGMLRMGRAQLTKERDELAATQTIIETDAWCCDYTDRAAPGTDVATLEIPGERGTVLVAPGARYPNSADGKLLARPAMSPAQAYFNAAILPGWQRFRPTYRFGVIVSLDKDNHFADVALEPAVSSANDLNVNAWTETIVAVPVVYMTCNATAFEEGDEVVVQFVGQDINQPRVIGFKSNPRPCAAWVARWTDGSRYQWTHAQQSAWDDMFGQALLIPAYKGDDGTWRTMVEGTSPNPAVERRFFGGTFNGIPALPPFMNFYTVSTSSGSYLERVAQFTPSGGAGTVGSDELRIYVQDGTGKMHMHLACNIDALWRTDVRGTSTGQIQRIGSSIPILPFEGELGTFP